MPSFRLYEFGVDHHIRRRIDLDVGDEAEALAAAERHYQEGQLELWNGSVKLRTFTPPPSADSHSAS